MLHAIQSLLRPRPSEAVRRTYIALVATARNPFFFTRLEVPDTMDGRFEVMVLHVFLLQQRLHHAAPEFCRQLSEIFLADMDHSLRELGIGDSGVSRRIKQMGKAYHGRLQAYAAGLAADDGTLQHALARNLYGTVAQGDPALLHQAAEWLRAQHAQLADADTALLTRGDYAWPAPAVAL